MFGWLPLLLQSLEMGGSASTVAPEPEAPAVSGGGGGTGSTRAPARQQRRRREREQEQKPPAIPAIARAALAELEATAFPADATAGASSQPPAADLELAAFCPIPRVADAVQLGCPELAPGRYAEARRLGRLRRLEDWCIEHGRDPREAGGLLRALEG